MIRLIAWIILVFALAAGAAWLAGHPGHITLDWGGWRVETSLAVATLGVAVLVAIGTLIFRLWQWIRRGPQRLNHSRAAGRQRRGYLALTRGLVAIAAGDEADARRYAAATGKLLDSPPLTLLLTAQAAQMSGNEKAAAQAYTAMLDRPETEFLGLRGLIVQALRRHDRGAALDLTRRAAALRPTAGWVMRELVALESAAGQPDAARAAIARGLKQKALSAAEAQRYRAILAYEDAVAAESHGQAETARKQAVTAAGLAPALTPAVVLAARLLAAAGKPRKAAGLLTTAWAQAPHPELVDAYLALYADAKPAGRLARVQELVAHHPDQPAGRLALARELIGAGDLPAARQQLDALLQQKPSPQAAQLMAEVEEAQYGDTHAARSWLLRAAALPPDPAWCCKACGAATPTWNSRCAACGAFDQLQWKSPGAPVPAGRSPAAALAPALLPPESPVGSA